MQRNSIGLYDFSSSVVAVPPVAWTDDLQLAAAANRALVEHIEAGGVRILLYGGNANLYHFDLGRFDALLDLLPGITAPDTWVIPSIGPDFGKALDEAAILRRLGFADAMMLPTAFPARPAGIEKGLRLVADALGAPLVLYLKKDAYLAPDQIASLVRDGAVKFVKYAVERNEPAEDRYLDDVIAAIGIEHVASGMGETPIHDHLVKRRLTTYTSGGVCIAPAAAMRILASYKAGDIAGAEAIREPLLAFERTRAAIDGFAVLHDGVTLSGIADMGPILPLCANLAPADREKVRPVIEALVQLEAECRAESRAAAE